MFMSMFIWTIEVFSTENRFCWFTSYFRSSTTYFRVFVLHRELQPNCNVIAARDEKREKCILLDMRLPLLTPLLVPWPRCNAKPQPTSCHPSCLSVLIRSDQMQRSRINRNGITLKCCDSTKDILGLRWEYHQQWDKQDRMQRWSCKIVLDT